VLIAGKNMTPAMAIAAICKERVSMGCYYTDCCAYKATRITFKMICEICGAKVGLVLFLMPQPPCFRMGVPRAIFRSCAWEARERPR
jgi:hypothetical protein